VRRSAIIAAGVVVIVAVVAAAALYWLLSKDGVRQALETQATSWLGQPVRIGGAALRVLPRVAIHLSDVRVGEPVAMTLSSVDLSAPLGALIRRRIEDATVVVSGSRIVMPMPFGLPATKSGDAEPDGQSIRLVSIRGIALREVTVVSRGRTMSITADAALRGDELTLSRLTATSGATSLRASGVVMLAPRVDARLRVVADRVDLDELLSLAHAFSPPAASAAPSTRPAVRLAARISAAKVQAAGIEGRNFAGDLQVQGNDLTMSPMSVQLFGGRYEGALTAALGSTLQMTLRSRVSDIDVAQLAAFGGVPGAVTGRLSGAGTFAGTGPDMSAVLRSVRGNATASIVDGTIAHLDLVGTVVAFFGRTRSNARTGSDRFDRLDAAFSVAQQVVRASALALHATDADLVGSGSLVLPTTALDGRVDLSLSETLSQEAGRDLYRYTREGNRVVLPATIGGTLGSPRLGIDAAAALQRGLRNEIQQRLGDLLGRLPR